MQVELPFDIEEFIRRQSEYNKRALDQIIFARQGERENLSRNMQLVAEAQREDRRFFNRSLILVLAGAGGIVLDEAEYLGQAHYSEIARAKRLRELYQEFVRGNLSWDVISEYVSELNRELKEEILQVVERKIESPDANSLEATLPMLLPLITDEQRDIRAHSRRLATRVVTASRRMTNAGVLGIQEQIEVGSDPLSVNSPLQITRLIDNKSGIHGC